MPTPFWDSLAVGLAMLAVGLVFFLRRRRHPPGLVILAVALQGVAGVGLVVSAFWHVRWLELGLAYAIAIVAVVCGLTVVVAGLFLSRGSSDEAAGQTGGSSRQSGGSGGRPGGATYEVAGQEITDPPAWFGPIFALTFVWTALLGLWAVIPDGADLPPLHHDSASRVRIPSPIRTLGEWYDKAAGAFGAVVTVAIIAGLVIWVLRSLVKGDWEDAGCGLGCLGILAVVALIVFLIGGWALLSQLRIGVGNPGMP